MFAKVANTRGLLCSTTFETSTSFTIQLASVIPDLIRNLEEVVKITLFHMFI